nr:hypothetical protein [Ktedonobacteraceae bacterium]
VVGRGTCAMPHHGRPQGSPPNPAPPPPLRRSLRPKPSRRASGDAYCSRSIGDGGDQSRRTEMIWKEE